MAYRKYQRKDANGNICTPLTISSQVVDEQTEATLEQTLLIIKEQINDLEKRDLAEIPTFTGVVDTIDQDEVVDQTTTQYFGIFYIKPMNVFAALNGANYYTGWQAQGYFQSSKCYNQNGVAVENRIYYLKDMFDTENAPSLVFLKSGSFVDVSDNAEIEDLQTRVETLEDNTVTIANDFTTGGTDKALSAEMGKELDFRTLMMMGVTNPHMEKDYKTFSEIDYKPIELEGLIHNGQIFLRNNYYHTSPIFLSKGEVLVIWCNSYSPIWGTDVNGSYYKDLGYRPLKLYASQYYKHIAIEDCYVSLAYYRQVDTLPESNQSAVRIYKYTTPTETHIKELIENNIELIKQIGAVNKKSGDVVHSSNIGISCTSQKILVEITSAPEGRLIISVLDKSGNITRLQDYAVIGKVYNFDINTDNYTLIVQNFTGVDGFIEFKVTDGYLQYIYETILQEIEPAIDDVAEENNRQSEEISGIGEEVDAINELFVDVQSTNLFNPNDQDILLGKYINSEGNTSNNSSYNISGYIPVEGGKTFYFGKNGIITTARTLEFYDSSRKVIAGSFVGGAVSSVTAPSDAVYMRCTAAVGEWGIFQVNADELRTYEEWFEPYKIVKIEDGSITMDMLSEPVKSAIGVKTFNAFTAESELSQGEVLTLSTVHIGKNSVESAHIDGEFSKIIIGVGYLTNDTYLNRDYASCWVEIDKTSIKQYRSYNNTEEYTLIDEKEHNLTLTNSTVVEINNQVEDAKLRVYNDAGDFYEQVIQAGTGTPFLINEGVEPIIAKLSFMPQDINKSIWAFGDSYFSFTSNSRWPYYFHQNGYTNWLSNNQPGLSPKSALEELKNLLLLEARPKYILWCLGMNGSTTENTDTDGNFVINPYHKDIIDSVLELCDINNIALVLATIPTVPTRQKTGFNNYVRSLGVKFIDFEKAVGTNSSGEWNEGLLSSDGIHPTERGAKVLASRVLADFPELTIL